jgi:hypothetical protein
LKEKVIKGVFHADFTVEKWKESMSQYFTELGIEIRSSLK